MSYVATITDTTTGEERRKFFDLPWTEGCEYLWSDGNFGCDCNRGNWFQMAGGGLAADFDNHPCNGRSPNRYRVVIRVEGKVVYEDET